MNRSKRIIAALLAAALTLPAFSCGEKISQADGNNVVSNAENSAPAESNAEALPQETQAGEASKAEAGDSSSADKPAEDSGKSKEEQKFEEGVVTDANGGRNQILAFETPDNVDEDAIVSTIRGTDGKIYAPVTDINKKPVTEANGEQKTEIYTGETNAASYEDPAYQPALKAYQAYWLDISKRQDFVFDGNLIEFEAKIADDAKDGVYPVEVYFADLSNYSANTDENASKLKDVAFRAGYVCVNSEKPEIPALTDKLTLTPDTVTAKPGDTIRMNIRIDNNPGLVAFVIRMHYDSKFMTITEGGAGSDLGELARLTTNTLDD